MRPFLLCSLLLVGCATTMTTSAIPSTDPRSLAAAFATELDAAPVLCSADAADTQVTAYDRRLDQGLVAGLVEGLIPVASWRACMASFQRGAVPAQAVALDEAIAPAYVALVQHPAFESSPALQARLDALHAVYLGSGVAHTGALEQQSLDALRAARADDRLGPIARTMADELFVTIDLEHGELGGRVVDAALLDELYAKSDVPMLSRMAAHLPTAEGRTDARRRLVRLSIARSTLPEVCAHAAEVEARVMATGTNTVALDEAMPLSATLDQARLVYRSVRVAQDLVHQTAALIGHSGEDPSSPAVADMQLRGALRVEVAGFASPLTLCDSPTKDDPTPCIAPADVQVGGGLGSVDAAGTLRLAAALPMSQAVALGARTDEVELPLVARGHALVTLRVPLSYERPDDLVLTTSAAGADGPSLDVAVDHRHPSRYVFTADDGQARSLAVVEAADLASFHVESRGGRGASGAFGMSGPDGIDGGECGSGSDGSDGSDGGDGGPGGAGGDVTVHVLCGANRCDDDVRALGAVVRSVGGPGGAGGRGGSGGRGGAAGTDRQKWVGAGIDGDHTVLEAGCSGGPAGRDGSSGRDGSDGPRGRAGRVRFAS